MYTTDRNQFTGSLRQLADYLDTHPGIPVPTERTIQYSADYYDEGGKAEVDAIASELGTPVEDRTAIGGHYVTTRTFGLIEYRIVAIPLLAMELYRAASTYDGCVTPDTAA